MLLLPAPLGLSSYAIQLLEQKPRSLLLKVENSAAFELNSKTNGSSCSTLRDYSSTKGFQGKDHYFGRLSGCNFP